MSRRAIGLALALAAISSACDRRAPAPPPAPVAAAPAKETTPLAARLCEHRVPADLCTRCNPDLVAVFKDTGDWCGEHGVPESQCFKCNPDLTFDAPAVPADWCREHALPESKCTKCSPRLIPKFIEAGDFCREHGFPKSVCPRCNPELAKAAGQPPPTFPEPGTIVRLASVDTAREAGIRTLRIAPQPFAPVLEVVGTLAFDGTRLALVSARTDAIVVAVKVDVGDEVRAGQPLVLVSSASIGADRVRLEAARGRQDAATRQVERERGLAQKGISSRSELENAERDLASARGEYEAATAALRGLGAGTGGGGGTALTAPFPGTVVARRVVAGQAVTAGQELLEIANVSVLWAELEVPEDEARAVRPGQPVQLRLEGRDDEPIEGRIARLAPAVDPRTRTVHARVVVPNRDRSLRAGRFLRARIRIGDERQALLVPRDAVQRAEGSAFVFVKRDEGVYEPLPVRLGAIAGDRVEVLAGLDAGAEIVTTGAFLLKTEIMKESIGAGCCDVGGGK